MSEEFVFLILNDSVRNEIADCIPEDITNANLALLTGMEIQVVAQAIQADGFDDADAAWIAFDAQ